MRFVIVAVLTFITAAPVLAQRSQGLRDFSQFATAINQEVAVVELDGTKREGVVVAASADGVTMKFSSGMRTYTDTQIASAERLKDGRLDGVAKGILFGAVAGLLGAAQGSLGQWVQGVASMGAIGYLLDAAETNREALYRGPATSSVAAGSPLASTVAFRIRF